MGGAMKSTDEARWCAKNAKEMNVRNMLMGYADEVDRLRDLAEQAMLERDVLIQENRQIDSRPVAKSDTAEVDALTEKAGRTCGWENEEDGIWIGSCGITWCFIEGDVKENKLIYCPKCGGKVFESTLNIPCPKGKEKMREEKKP